MYVIEKIIIIKNIKVFKFKFKKERNESWSMQDLDYKEWRQIHNNALHEIYDRFDIQILNPRVLRWIRHMNRMGDRTPFTLI